MELLRITFLYLFIVLTAVTEVADAYFCLETKGGNGLPEFRNYGVQPRLVRHQQAIIPSYKFECYGNVTEWGVDVHRGGRGADGSYDLDLQVWRPSPTVNDSTGSGCYSLVGNNRFTSISLRNLVAIVTPSPQDYIQFQPGDVLGFYVEETGDDDSDGVVVLTSDSFTSEVVWYGSIMPSMATSQNGACPYSVGTDGVLNTSINAAPVISIATNTYLCSVQSLQTTQVPIPQSCFNLSPSNTPVPSVTDSRGQSPTSAPRPVSFVTAALVVIVTLVVISILTIIISVVILTKAFKLKRARYSSVFIPTATNAAYGLSDHEAETEMNGDDLLSRTYDYPSPPDGGDLSSNSLVDNEAYLRSHDSDDFQTQFHDANNVIEN